MHWPFLAIQTVEQYSAVKGTCCWRAQPCASYWEKHILYDCIHAGPKVRKGICGTQGASTWAWTGRELSCRMKTSPPPPHATVLLSVPTDVGTGQDCCPLSLLCRHYTFRKASSPHLRACGWAGAALLRSPLSLCHVAACQSPLQTEWLSSSSSHPFLLEATRTCSLPLLFFMLIKLS